MEFKNKTRMKIKPLILLLSLFASVQQLVAQTGFTYQGRLNDNGQPANGIYDFQFRLYDAETGGTQVPVIPVSAGVAVTNGLFTTGMDFGEDVFDGTTYWLEIAVQAHNGGGFVTLSPRQLITPAPEAIYAESVDANGITGSLPATALGGAYNNSVSFENSSNSFAGAFVGEGGGLNNLDASHLTTGTIPDAQLSANVARTSQVWLLNGNSGVTGGQFLGTTGNQPLQLKAGTSGAFRIEPTADSPNVIGGSSSNVVAGGFQGSTISGGGLLAFPNTIAADFATIAGGTFGAVDGSWGTISGGRDNRVHAESATVGGGFRNNVQSNSLYSTIAGGWNNTIFTNSSSAFIGGGNFNSISNGSPYATVAGGSLNQIGTSAYYATVAGGYGNSVLSNCSFSVVGGGSAGVVSNDSRYAVLGGGFQNLIRTNSSYSTIGGGKYNQTGAEEATVSGGALNNALGFSSAIGGGGGNYVEGVWSVIAGGRDSVIVSNGVYSAIGGGRNNRIESANGYSIIAGGYFNWIQTNGTLATIGGGYSNTNSGYGATISGGQYNLGSGDNSVVSGGGDNIANAFGSTVSGGTQNDATGIGSTVGGGHFNEASGAYAVVPGGTENAASGDDSFAAGYRAKAVHKGAFVWGDSSLGNISSTANDSVTMRASGGYRLFSNSGASVGVSLASGSGSWTTLSDRNAKENFKSVDGTEVLERLAQIPIQTWNYKSQDDSIRHLGPMAQDFKAAFGIGETDTGISAVDADGVALAAIQGLNQKLQQKETEIAELKARLEKLEQIINQGNGGAR
jgi:hypothetical protein